MVYYRKSNGVLGAFRSHYNEFQRIFAGFRGVAGIFGRLHYKLLEGNSGGFRSHFRKFCMRYRKSQRDFEGLHVHYRAISEVIQMASGNVL